MERIQRETLFESRDRLIVTPRLQMKLPEKIQRVCVSRIEHGYTFKCFNGGVSLRQRSIGDAEVVPGPCVLWLPSRGVEKNVARFRKLLAVQQRNAFIQSSC